MQVIETLLVTISVSIHKVLLSYFPFAQPHEGCNSLLVLEKGATFTVPAS